ncbi:serine hydrolase [Spirosoma sp. KCTC 42546]|uniref:serine hydrolase n=1 Tax=Spirosoma sp. KCTC 42546 TaxID=2520506 RepID=UPI0011576100|nr:serine hydrolase [Spirosoma sp. KCTC 42546]QDK82780.1 serine hydrolase [Spirosoma sp. KCTC 42546]
MAILRFVATLLGVFACSSFLYGQTAPTDNVETVIQREMKERQIPGLQLAVVQHGQLVLLKSYGMANLQTSTPVTNQRILSINSCTKAFTGIAIMQLVEEGKLELTAPVSRYLDNLPETWQPITLWQLLTHISGLPDVNQVIDTEKEGHGAAFNEEAIWAKTKARPMDFPTGEQYRYNQTNYVLLGKIIDKLSGKPFVQVFQERQFQVAGMPGTVFGDSRDVIPNKTQSYGFTTKIDGQVLAEPKLTNAFEEFAPFRRTASGLNSTAEDMAHWVIALQQGKLLKTKSALNRLWTPGTYKNGSPTQWAVGWVTKPRPKHRAVITTGGGRSALFVYPDDDLAIVVLTNLAGSFPEEFIDELAGCYNPDIPAADPITALHMELRKQGFTNAIDVANELKKKNSSFNPSEDDLNDWAYRLMARRQLQEALGIFKLNVSLYPKSWNVYDSYGEALLKNGQKDEAIAMYKKSIELNPDNQNGKGMLARIAGN